LADEENEEAVEEFKFQSVGEQLKAAREEIGLELSDIAAKTRVPLRHLESIETSNYDELPSPTYAIGFAKSFARTVSLSEVKIGQDLREEMSSSGSIAAAVEYNDYEPSDPARLPSMKLALIGLFLAIVVIAGVRFFYYGDGADILNSDKEVMTAEAEKTDEEAVASVSVAAPITAATTTAQTPPPPAGGKVVLTATDSVWLKIYDADNKRLFENLMSAGETFEVPADANKPQILTGRPQALKITIGGQEVAPLGVADITIKDVEISAAALIARPAVIASAETRTTQAD